MTDTPTPLIRIRDLRYSYPGGPEVLRIPALDVTGRGLIAITGPSGAGKSTLVELLAGTLHEGYEGSVEVLGEEWTSLRRDADRQRHLRRVGFIPQDFGLLPSRTPREMLEQDLRDSGVSAAEHAERIERALAEVGLSEFADERIASLSGGQGQRVAVARMLARDVDLVIADEPTANLDPGLRDAVMGLLRTLSRHVPVLVVTHDATVAEACDRTIILQAAAARPERPPAQTPGRHHLRRLALASLALLLVVGGAVGAVLASKAHQVRHGGATSSRPGVGTTTAPATIASTTTLVTMPPSTAAVVPDVSICGGTPEYKPTSLYWCVSLCSNYVEHISWTSWTPQEATGVGVLMTNNGIPDCASGTWTPHPGYVVTLDNPAVVDYCGNDGVELSGLLFTSTNVFDATKAGSLPFFKPPCSG